MKALLLKTGRLLWLGLLLLAAGRANAQVKRKILDKYESLDRMLRLSLLNRIVTNEAYEALLYKKGGGFRRGDAEI